MGHIKKVCWKWKRMQKKSKSKNSTSRDDSDDGGALVKTHGTWDIRSGFLILDVLFI